MTVCDDTSALAPVVLMATLTTLREPPAPGGAVHTTRRGDQAVTPTQGRCSGLPRETKASCTRLVAPLSCCGGGSPAALQPAKVEDQSCRSVSLRPKPWPVTTMGSPDVVPRLAPPVLASVTEATRGGSYAA